MELLLLAFLIVGLVIVAAAVQGVLSLMHAVGVAMSSWFDQGEDDL